VHSSCDALGLPQQCEVACREGRTLASGLGSSQDWVYRKVGGNMGGASTLFSCRIVASCGTWPTHT